MIEALRGGYLHVSVNYIERAIERTLGYDEVPGLERVRTCRDCLESSS